TPSHDKTARWSRRCAPGELAERSVQIYCVSERGSEPSQTVWAGEHNVSGRGLLAGLPWRAMIAAVSFHTAAVGIHGVDLWHGSRSHGVRSFKQDASVAENISRQRASGRVGQF